MADHNKVLHYRRNEQLAAVLVAGAGDVTVADFESIADEIQDDLGIDKDWVFVVDLRGLRIQGELAPARARARSTRNAAAASRMAFVGEADHEYGVARMFATIADTQENPVGVFRDFKSALEWLYLPPDAFGALEGHG